MKNETQSFTVKNKDAILRFQSVFEEANFQPGKLVTRPGNFPYWDYDNSVVKFIRALYSNGWIIDFNWPEWQQEAERFWNNPEMIEQADVDTIKKLLTTHVRKDRFCDGHMAQAIKNGHIVTILRRLKELSEDND